MEVSARGSLSGEISRGQHWAETGDPREPRHWLERVDNSEEVIHLPKAADHAEQPSGRSTRWRAQLGNHRLAGRASAPDPHHGGSVVGLQDSILQRLKSITPSDIVRRTLGPGPSGRPPDEIVGDVIDRVTCRERLAPFFCRHPSPWQPGKGSDTRWCDTRRHTAGVDPPHRQVARTAAVVGRVEDEPGTFIDHFVDGSSGEEPKNSPPTMFGGRRSVDGSNGTDASVAGDENPTQHGTETDGLVAGRRNPHG